MLETIREYAAERLGTTGHGDRVRGRHAELFLDLVFEAGRGLRGAGQAAALELLELEADNVRTALRWEVDHGEADRVAGAGWALMPFWWLRGLFDEGAGWMTEAMESGGLSNEARAQALLVTGFIAFWRGDYATSIPALTEALGVFTSVGDRHRAALARLPAAVAQASRDDPAAIDAIEESRAVLAEAGDDWSLMWALNALGWALNALQRDAPLEVFEEARSRAEAFGSTGRSSLPPSATSVAGERSAVSWPRRRCSSARRSRSCAP